MAYVRGLRLTFIVLLMILGMVKGRWLELEPYSTQSMISDGIHDVNLRTGASDYSFPTTMLYGGKRCESIYGFLPCADTMAEGVFLMLMYTYLMMLGEEWIHKGGEDLFELLGDKAIGSSVFKVLMALPRIIVVIVAGVVSTESSAQDQVVFGASMYAGSTLITLTFIWGLCITLNRDKLRGKNLEQVNENQQDSTTNCLPLRHKLSYLNDNGVNIDDMTGTTAVIMLLSLIPFATVEILSLFNSPVTILSTLIVSGVSLVSYFAYQILTPVVGLRSLAYLQEENLQTRFLYNIQRLANDDLCDQHGNPNFEVFERIFKKADMNDDGSIEHKELEDMIEEIFEQENEHISKQYAKVEILSHFDDDKSELINWAEFQKGCTKWLKKWKDVENDSNHVSKNLWVQVEKAAIRKKRESLTHIDKIMPRILKQVHEKHEIVKQNGDPDIEKIEEIFSQYDHDNDKEIHQGEIKEFIESLSFGVSLDHNTIFKEIKKNFRKNNNFNIVRKDEFVEGFRKWIDKALKHDPRIKDPKRAFAKFEKDSWPAEIDIPIKVEKSISSFCISIVYLVFGVGIMFVISGAFMQSILQFSNAANMSLDFTSFVVFPIAMNAKMIITSLLQYMSNSSISRNASLTFSEMYDRLVMNNLLGLVTLLITVHMKGLSWTYSNEMLTIMIPCAVVGLFAFWRDTYPLWASITGMLLYPIYVCVFCVSWF